MTRRRVQCWLCGRVTRRKPQLVAPHYDPWYDRMMGSPEQRPGAPLRIYVIGRRRRVTSYSRCNAPAPGGVKCDGTLLRPRDAAFVLRAAIQHEQRGGNKRSEHDL